MLKKFFYNNLENADLRPHAPYYSPAVYRPEKELFQAFFKHPDYNFIGDCDVPESERHDILIYSSREGVYGDFRWLVPELQRPDVDAFTKSKAAKKTVLLLNAAWDDPQVYVDKFSEKALFCENHRDLWAHPLVQTNEEELYRNYFYHLAERVGPFEKQKESFRKLKEQLNCDLLVIPLLYIENFRDDGLKDEEGIMFVDNTHSLLDTLIEGDVKSIQSRKYDCFFAGAVSPGIYPYRFAFEKKIQGMSDLKIHDNNYEYTKYRETRFGKWVRNYERDVKEGVRKDVSDFFLNRAFEQFDEAHYSEYMKTLEDSKISLCCASIFGYPLRKFIEGMAMGSVVVGQMPKHPDKYGIIDNVHMVSCTIDGMEDTIRQLLKEPERMQEISKNAKKLVKERYTISKLADKWLSLF